MTGSGPASPPCREHPVPSPPRSPAPHWSAWQLGALTALVLPVGTGQGLRSGVTEQTTSQGPPRGVSGVARVDRIHRASALRPAGSHREGRRCRLVTAPLDPPPPGAQVSSPWRPRPATGRGAQGWTRGLRALPAPACVPQEPPASPRPCCVHVSTSTCARGRHTALREGRALSGRGHETPLILGASRTVKTRATGDGLSRTPREARTSSCCPSATGSWSLSASACPPPPPRSGLQTCVCLPPPAAGGGGCWSGAQGWGARGRGTAPPSPHCLQVRSETRTGT